MISVIIPYMAIWPYTEKLPNTLRSLKNQTVSHETIISEHPVERFIRLNYLLNKAVEYAKHERIFFCNADTLIEDKTLFQRMLKTDYEVIFCCYYSDSEKGFKPSDGAGVFTSKEVLKRFGKFDESLTGISKATFKFVWWALNNTKWHCSKDFQIQLNREPKPKTGRINFNTLSRCRGAFKNARMEFERRGLWGF